MVRRLIAPFAVWLSLGTAPALALDIEFEGSLEFEARHYF